MKYDADSIDNRQWDTVERVVSSLEPWLGRFFHPIVRGLERIPPGPALYVANHNGGVLFPDAYVLATAIHRNRERSDLPYVLAHDLAVRPAFSNWFFPPLGAVRASHDNALKLLFAGRKVLVFPGGDVEAFRPFRDRDRIVFGSHRGYVQLAIEAGVPILPVVAAGAHATLMVLDDGVGVSERLGLHRLLRVKVFPTVLSIPWGLTVGLPPPYLPYPTRIYMELLPPIRFERSGSDAARDHAYVERCHAEVVSAMQAALTRLAADRAADGRARNAARLDALSSRLRLAPRSRRALHAIACGLRLVDRELPKT